MNGCEGQTTSCDGVDLLPVKLGLSRHVKVFCRGCRSGAADMGLQVVERRVASRPVAHDKRRFVPAWRRSGRIARDLTGALR